MLSSFEEIRVVAPADLWPTLRKDVRFVELMRLARVANSLALAWDPLLTDIENQSPKARRTRFAALFYSAALLKEGLHTARGLARWFREFPQYKEGVAKILADPAVQALESELLVPVRNAIVFHFDRAPLKEGLLRLPDSETILCTYPASGPEIGLTYFDAADDAMLGYLFGVAPSDQEYLARLERFMVGTSGLFTQFMIAAHKLIAAGFVSLGCKKRKGVRNLHDDDTISLD